MKAMVLESLAPLERSPLQLRERAEPTPGFGQIVIRVHACGVCRSQLHMIEGEWAARGVPAILPIVPGHEIVGSIVELGPGVQGLALGQRVGVQPLWSCCGHCAYCLTARENLCANKEMAGETIDGGFAEYMLATAEHVYPVPESLGDAEAAPLFCPGLAAYGAVAKAGLSPGAEVAVSVSVASGTSSFSSPCLPARRSPPSIERANTLSSRSNSVRSMSSTLPERTSRRSSRHEAASTPQSSSLRLTPSSNRP